MGQYFYFKNRTTNEENDKSCPWNMGLTWVTKLNTYEAEEIKIIMKYMILSNEWNEEDDIYAEGDSGYILEWKDYKDIKLENIEDFNKYSLDVACSMLDLPRPLIFQSMVGDVINMVSILARLGTDISGIKNEQIKEFANNIINAQDKNCQT